MATFSITAVAHEAVMSNSLGRAIAVMHCCKHVPVKLINYKIMNTDYYNAFEDFKKTSDYHKCMTTMFEKGILNPYSQNILRTAFEAAWNSNANKIKQLLEKYEEWEAMMIADNAMWWPYAEKDAMSGKTYDMMLELQAKRNELLGR